MQSTSGIRQRLKEAEEEFAKREQEGAPTDELDRLRHVAHAMRSELLARRGTYAHLH